MKKHNLFFSLFLLITVNLFSQSYSTWFTNPTDGSTISGGTGSPMSVHFTFSWNGSKSNQYNTWRFELISLNDPVGVLPKTTSNHFTDEYTPYFDLSYYACGQYEATIKMYEYDFYTSNTTLRATSSITFTIGYTVIVENIFGGGTVSVNGSAVSSGTSFVVSPGGSLSLSAIEQTYGGYSRVWNSSGTNYSDWRKNGIYQSYSSSYSFSPSGSDNGAHLTAGLRPVYNPTFSNNFGSGIIYLDGSQYSSGSSISKVENNSVSANAPWQLINGIEYTFSRWQDYNTTNPRSFQINSSSTYTAYYTGKPTNSGKYASAGGIVGQPIVVTWTDNINTAVNQFQIWRKVKHNGVVGSPTLLSTVDRGVQTYTDNEYSVTNGYTDDLLYYDVRAYYSTEGTYSDPDYTAVFGRPEAEIDNSLSEKNTRSLVVPSDYSITNYPNPFNPTTTINYQLPENGFVTIKVYDLLGKEVAVLVNENKSTGYYKVDFNASKLTSGVYVYTITTNNFIQSKKMLLMK
ncbi:MAG: T9SS C-terminal target domain-containing protein [Ignavibacteriales bacterium]|nr:MAG: T9SS C-terminal target domain-containing protein [Ignavibacteriales bacterium]